MADILLVEDDPDIAELVQIFLEGAGHHVRLARNGREGLERLEERLPDVVVMDVEMPVLTGPQMVERMFVENMGRDNIPVVVVSAAMGLSAVAKRIGTPYHLSKPFSPEALLGLVDQALGERRIPQPGW
ncbi:MAG: response regulator [Deltaproteobacteria bacterium]|nr:response regulator [Deltaproteobacteria bacterium]